MFVNVLEVIENRTLSQSCKAPNFSLDMHLNTIVMFPLPVLEIYLILR